MTRKFKKVVKAYVADGVLTDEEKSDLKKLAENEGISVQDAHLYMTGELKKRKAKLEKPSSGIDKGAKIGEILVTVGGLVISAISLFRKK